MARYPAAVALSDDSRHTTSPGLWTLLCASLALAGCGSRPVSQPVPVAGTIDLIAQALMQRENVEGLALAVVDNGAVVHVAAYGVRNAARDPLTTQTIMYGASLTKTAFAYMVMQLVDEVDSTSTLRSPNCSPAVAGIRGLSRSGWR